MEDIFDKMKIFDPNADKEIKDKLKGFECNLIRELSLEINKRNDIQGEPKINDLHL
jgi:hypothetical protein